MGLNTGPLGNSQYEQEIFLGQQWITRASRGRDLRSQPYRREIPSFDQADSDAAVNNLQKAIEGVKSIIERMKSLKSENYTWTRDNMENNTLIDLDHQIDLGNEADEILHGGKEFSMDHAYLSVQWDKIRSQVLSLAPFSATDPSSESELAHYQASLRLLEAQNTKREMIAAEMALGQASSRAEQPLDSLLDWVDIPNENDILSPAGPMSEAEFAHYQVSLKLLEDQTVKRAKIAEEMALQQGSSAEGTTQLSYRTREGVDQVDEQEKLD